MHLLCVTFNPFRLNPKKHRSGLAAKLGSIRRTGGRSNPRTSSRPTISHPIPIHPEPEADTTDGGDPPSSTASDNGTLTSTIIANSAERQSQHQAILKVGADTSPSFRRKSGKAIIANYKQDTVSLDSASVSSQSEVSDPQLTASGERCYLHADSRPDQLLYNGGNGVVTTAMDGESSLEATLRSPQSAESASIEIGSSRPLIHISNDNNNDYDHLFDDYDHLDDLSPPPPSLAPLPAQNGITPGVRRTNRIGSVDFEKVPEVVGGEKLEVSSINRQELWKNSIVEVESDSDSETNKDMASTKLSTDNDEGPPQSLEKASSTPSPSHPTPPTAPTTSAANNLYSDIEAVGSKDQGKLRPDESNYYNFSVLVSQMNYANVFIPGPGGNAYGGSSAPVKRARPRSKSSSPQSPKKPVPLPRRVTAGVLQNGLLTSSGTTKSGVGSEKSSFVESLPANFRPQPPPKPSSLAGHSPKVGRRPNSSRRPTTCPIAGHVYKKNMYVCENTSCICISVCVLVGMSVCKCLPVPCTCSTCLGVHNQCVHVNGLYCVNYYYYDNVVLFSSHLCEGTEIQQDQQLHHLY